MALIEMSGVTKKYRRSTTALRNLNLSIQQGEFVYLVGPSGAGKSSLIRLLYREEKLSSGRLKVGEFNLNKLKRRQIPILRRSIGVVFQEVLELVGLKHKMRSFPTQLSGGEQQRVAIARAIVNNPKLLIADEPTGNLDPEIAWEIMHLLERINLQGTTVLMATHNSQIVNTLRHRVIEIEAGSVIRDEEKGEYGYHD